MYVIGTAGHIDHGKSTLIQALTGIDPDRLREEKERGMTIDLGFAWLTLPGGTEVSVVDVPGHERFIKNMLAGVGGIDLALLVVAADEGVMPQTREHLAILDLLGIRSGVVAITKVDLVDADWLELVQADVAETLTGTTLEGAPLVACSATTRAGLPELLQAIEGALATTAPKRDIGRPRLPIDRAFTIAGFGTVVTGTLVDGSLRTGQEVVIEPGGLRTRIRGLQNHKHRVETALPGSRTAVNVAGLPTEALSRGMVLTAPAWLQPTLAVDVRLHAVRDLAHPLRHNVQVTFHSGAAEVPAKLRLLDADTLAAGGDAWAQVRLLDPAAVVKGDAFVLRSPNATLAGGKVVDSHPRRHRRNHAPTISSLLSLERGTPQETIYEVLAKLEPADPATVTRESDLGAAGVQDALASLVAEGRVVPLGGDIAVPGVVLYTLPGYQKLTDRAGEAVRAFLREHGLRAGMAREELKSRLAVPPRLFNNLAARWVAEGVFEDRGSALAPPGREVKLTPAQQAEADRFLRSVRAAPYAPQVEHWPDRALLGYLAETGAIVAVKEDIAFDSAAYQRMVEQVVSHLRREPTITLAQVRDLFGTSRRYAQAFLEHLDERHVTRRVGDERVLRDPQAVAR